MDGQSEVKSGRRFSFGLFKRRGSQETLTPPKPARKRSSTCGSSSTSFLASSLSSVDLENRQSSLRRASNADATKVDPAAAAAVIAVALAEVKPPRSSTGTVGYRASVSMLPASAPAVPCRRQRATVAFEKTSLDAEFLALAQEASQSALEAISQVAQPYAEEVVVTRPRSQSNVTPPSMNRRNSCCDVRQVIRPAGAENPQHSSAEINIAQAEEARKQRERRPLSIGSALPEAVRQRNLVVNEIISTEQDYIADLEAMVEIYKRPMLESGVATKDEVQAIFSNVMQLIEVNKMLQLDMAVRVNGSNGNELGDSFLLFGDYLKMYAIYCSNQSAAREMLDKCMKKDKAFAEFIHHANLNQRNHRLTLRDYLIKPVQRICKYPLLLRELLKNTQNDHPDFEKLSLALTKIQNVVADINEKKQREEEMAAMFKVKEQLKSTEKLGVQLLAPGRKYLQEGVLHEASKDKKDLASWHYFLFTDMLVLTNGSTGGSGTRKSAKLDVVSVVPFNPNQLVISEKDNSGSVMIEKGNSVFMMPFVSLELKRKWAQLRPTSPRRAC